MATKKKKDDEESFASKLAGVGDALSEGGEDEAESSLESISKIVDGISAIAEARKAAKEAKLTKNAIKGGQGDYSWGGPEEKKQLKTDKAVKGGKGDFSDFGAVKDFFGDLGSGALSTLGMLDPRVIASMGKSKENIAALSKRIDNNKKRLGEETVNKNGIVTSVNEVLEFAGTNAGDPPPDSSDKSLFVKGKVSQLDPTNPTHGVVAKAFRINHKNATAGEDNTQYKQMLEKVNKPIEDPKKEAEKLTSPMHSYDGPGSADFEAEREFRTGVKPKTQHKIETWRDLEDEQLPTPETSKPTEKVETPVEGLTETVIESGTNSTANRLQDILNNRKPLTSLFGNMR